jgi:predicted nucleotidyltransferase
MKLKTDADAQLGRWYRGADIPMRVIRRFARQVADRFHPDKIILFGSYAYGTPHADSDVDMLVVMPARNELDQAVRIRLEVAYNFPMDLLVRTPKNLSWRLAEGDPFLKEILARGKVLYEKDNPRVGTKSRGRLPRRPKAGTKPPAHA